MRDYRANVDLLPERDGTAIRWTSDFAAKVPGTGPIFRMALTRFMAAAAGGLASRAAEITGAPPV